MEVHLAKLAVHTQIKILSIVNLLEIISKGWSLKVSVNCEKLTNLITVCQWFQLQIL